MLTNKKKRKALILYGSPRNNGFTAKLLHTFIRCLNDSYSINIVDAYEQNIKPCVECNSCSKHESCFMPDFNHIDNLIKDSELLVIATPVYNLSVPSPLKAIFDRMQPYFNAKVKRKTQVFKTEKTGIALLTCGSDKHKCENILMPQLNIICQALNTNLKYSVILDNTDRSPNLDNCIANIQEICEKIK